MRSVRSGCARPDSTTKGLCSCMRSSQRSLAGAAGLEPAHAGSKVPWLLHLPTPQSELKSSAPALACPARLLLVPLLVGPELLPQQPSRDLLRAGGADSVPGRTALGDDALVLGENRLVQTFARVAVEGVCDVAERAVAQPPRRHRDVRRPLLALEHPAVANQETTVANHLRKGLDLAPLVQVDADFGDLHRCLLYTSPSPR